MIGPCRVVATVAAAVAVATPGDASAQQVVVATYSPVVMFSATEAVAVRSLGEHAGEVVVTRDAGETWRATADLSAFSVSHVEALCFGTRRVGILVGREGTVLRTADGGGSWRRHGRSPGGEGARCQMFGGSRGLLLAGGALLVTTDGGRRWRAIDEGLGPATDACFSDSLRGLMVATSGLHRTLSGGRTWHESLSRPGLSSVACSGRRRVWVGTAGGQVLASEDGGESWSEGAETGLAGVEWLAFANERVGFAMGSAEDAARTADGGRTWTAMDLPAGSRAPSFLGAGHGYCEGPALHLSADGGVSWTTMDTEYAPPAELLAAGRSPTADGEHGGATDDGEADPDVTGDGEGASTSEEGSIDAGEEAGAIYVNVGGRRIRVPRR